MARKGQEDGRRGDRPPKKERASERDREDERRRKDERRREDERRQEERREAQAARRETREDERRRKDERRRENDRRQEAKREKRATKKERREAKRELKAERDRAYWGDPDLWGDRPQKTQGFFLSSHNVQPKKRTVALVLCLLLGWCGAHRFYLGQKGIGAFYVVLLIISIFSVDYIAPIIVVFWVLDLICLFIARS